MFLLDLFQGVGGKCVRSMKLNILFWGTVVGRGKFKCGKMGDNNKKKSFINNSVEVVISFK